MGSRVDKNISNKETKLKRTLFVGLSTFVSSMIFYSGVNATNNLMGINNYSYDERTFLDLEESDAFSKNDFDILNEININKNIGKNEKYLFNNIYLSIKNIPYIDKDSAFNNISKLNILFTDRPKNIDEKIKGLYSDADKTIRIFQDANNYSKDILIHEFIHVLFSNNNNLDKYLIEGVTEILTNEYFSSNPYLEVKTYPFEVAVTKLLCELTDGDTILKTYSTGDISVLLNKLCEVSDYNDSILFLNNLALVFSNYENNESIDISIYNDCLKYIDNYLLKKYSENYNDEMFINTDYYKDILSLMFRENSIGEYIKYINNNGYISKLYFTNNNDKKVYVKK